MPKSMKRAIVRRTTVRPRVERTADNLRMGAGVLALCDLA